MSRAIREGTFTAAPVSPKLKQLELVAPRKKMSHADVDTGDEAFIDDHESDDETLLSFKQREMSLRSIATTIVGILVNQEDRVGVLLASDSRCLNLMSRSVNDRVESKIWHIGGKFLIGIAGSKYCGDRAIDELRAAADIGRFMLPLSGAVDVAVGIIKDTLKTVGEEFESLYSSMDVGMPPQEFKCFFAGLEAGIPHLWYFDRYHNGPPQKLGDEATDSFLCIGSGSKPGNAQLQLFVDRLEHLRPDIPDDEGVRLSLMTAVEISFGSLLKASLGSPGTGGNARSVLMVAEQIDGGWNTRLERRNATMADVAHYFGVDEPPPFDHSLFDLNHEQLANYSYTDTTEELILRTEDARQEFMQRTLDAVV